MLTTIDRDGNVSHQIIDADIEEKRRREDVLRRRVRPRLEDTIQVRERPVTRSQDTPTVSGASQSQEQDSSPRFQSAPVPPNPIPNSILQTPQQGPPPTDKRKFRLASKLQESVNIDDIGNNIMDTKVNLSLEEVFAISPDLSSWVNDRTKRTRHPVNSTTNTVSAGGDATLAASVHAVQTQPLYACPSGRARTLVNAKTEVSALLDDGSELNLMPRRTWEQLNAPIDTDINWRINGYNSKGSTGSETEFSGPLGVCHDILVSIGGVEVRLPIFVVEDSNQDLLLGRPWGRLVRAEFKNEDNGDYSCFIKSPDGRRQARFIAAKGDHERNRIYAREPEEGSIGAEWGKA
jgi:hypothetical protein